MQGKSVVSGELFEFFSPLSFLLRAFCSGGRERKALREREMRCVSCFRGKLVKIQRGNEGFWLSMEGTARCARGESASMLAAAACLRKRGA
jgi:hypothetical protein